MEKNPEREQTTIRLPVELKEELQQEADKRGERETDLPLIVKIYEI